jgi:ligand-binding sensor domain-containing protein/signal transduction histidine kinase
MHARKGNRPNGRRSGCLWVIFLLLAAEGADCRAAVLWSDLGATLAYQTGDGSDILGGAVKRDDSAADTLYFKFHVDPLSDASTEEYFAAFELYEDGEERIGVGNALKAWAYSAFKTDADGESTVSDYVDLNSSRPEPSGSGSFLVYEHPHRGLETTIVFKIQYGPGGDDLITVWLNPDLGPGASESSQPQSLITQFRANGSFDEIHLRHGGGGGGWIFSDMEIATSFADFVTGNGGTSKEPNSDVESGELPFTFRSWEREQGLPQNFVRALGQTRDGYVWVGSDDGVARFDGLRFVPFGLREGLNSGPVRALLGDSRGALWIGSADGGLTRWQDGQFTTLTKRNGLPSDSVNALAEDKAGRIWIGTEAGLALWQDGRLAGLPWAQQFQDKPVTALFEDSQQDMWLGVSGLGVFEYRRGRLAAVKDSSVGDLLKDPHSILVDRAGRLWVGAGDDFIVYRSEGRWHPYHIRRHQAKPYACALAEGPDGAIWVGSVGEGLFRFKDDKVTAITARDGLSDNFVESLLTDQDGVLWVGTHEGLDRQRPKTLFAFGPMEGLGSGSVHGLAEVAPGVVWAGKPSDGLYRLEGRNFRRLASAGLSLSGSHISTVLTARDGSCWVAAEHGLLHFKDPKAAANEADFLSLPGLEACALAEDGEGGLWVGTRQGELWRRWREQWQAQSNYWGSHAITAIVEDAQGWLFVATEGAGLYRCKGHSAAHFGKSEGLLSDLIRTLYLDRDGVLWIGTTGGGLNRWRDGKIDTFTTRERLPDNTISQILEDDFDRLWLGSDRGLACVNKRELDQLASGGISAIYPLVFGRGEGMPSEECASGFYPAGLKTRSGLLWFSTLKGVVVADPRPRLANGPVTAPVLEEVSLDGTPEPKIQGGQSALLRIPPGKHRLEFGYTAISFDAPDRVRFRYRLDKLDPDWIDAGTRRTAFYAYVPPGEYRFIVSAANSDGVWGPGTSLALAVAPHFWQAWWFLGLAGLAILCSVAGIARFVEKRKLQRRLKELEQERLLERERSRIAQDLHDEMGAKLCRISFLSEHARRAAQLPGDLRHQIASISADSREVLHSLDEIVWAVNPRNDMLESVASYIGQYAQDYFSETGIQCELDIPAELPSHPVSSQLRHHLFLAVHEALTNTLKHSAATCSKVSIACRQSTVEIVASDNGKGFDPASVESPAGEAGNGLRNMRQRLLDAGGYCQIEAQPGGGTIVRFVVPLNGQHGKS